MRLSFRRTAEDGPFQFHASIDSRLLSVGAVSRILSGEVLGGIPKTFRSASGQAILEVTLHKRSVGLL